MLIEYPRKPLRYVRDWVRRERLYKLYSRYQDATMIPREYFVDNLELAQRVNRDVMLNSYCVVECGTWRGGMSAALIEVLGSKRPYHFFDSFEGLPPAKEIDGEAASRWQSDRESPLYHDNCSASETIFRETINKTGIDQSFVHVHRGWFRDTLKTSNVGKIALLRLDGDWYDSTMDCLSALFHRVAKGGYIVIDDYGTWDGCTRAVHDYLSRQIRSEPIRRYGKTHVPFILKVDN